jgi:carboxymethylenebutenolidase
MNREIIDLYGHYTKGAINRRVFLRKLATLAGSAAAAWALLPLLEKSHGEAAMVPVDDSRLDAKDINYSGATGDVKAYWARPKGGDKLPGVVVIHENRMNTGRWCTIMPAPQVD